ncbi:Wzt carbohydrate-binding domain-containing protein, partial [Chrysosporum ovalisporum FSS-45]|nr:Wzt carbohydrate-binding domain-containing protein [Umezakia ovalisporum FSS-45]
FEDVVEFAEIGEAIDAPVQSYSSGMAARLGFACAIHTEPDILLIDEVLAVGDIRFRNKCTRKLAKLRDNGTSFLLVSHNSYAILSVCEIGIYLNRGVLQAKGLINSVVRQYEETLFLKKEAHPDNHKPKMLNNSENGEFSEQKLEIIKYQFENLQGEVIQTPETSRDVFLCLDCKVKEFINNVSIRLSVKSMSGEGEIIIFMNSLDDGKTFLLKKGLQKFRIGIPNLILGNGIYSFTVFICHGSPPIYTLDRLDQVQFKVTSPEGINSRFFQKRTWAIEDIH